MMAPPAGLALLLVLLVSCAMLSTPTAARGVMKLPLRKLTREFAFQQEEGERDAFYGAKFTGGHEGDIIVHDYMNAQYTVDVSLGTPPQTVTVIPDTGSSNLWAACKNRFLQHHKLYKKDQSSTYKHNGTRFALQYGSGGVTGEFVNDVWRLGPFEVTNSFGSCDNMAGFGIAWYVAKFDGILGLGFSALRVGGGPAPFQQLIDSGQLEQPVFAFYLSSTSGSEGELVVGGVDQSHYKGEFHRVPLTSETYWAVKLDGLHVDGEQVSQVTKAIVDSGTSLLAGPKADVAKIAEKLGATPLVMGEYSIPCDANGPDVEVELNGKKFALSAQDYIINSGGACILGMIGINLPPPAGPLWILGDVFMRKYYVKFDWGDQSVGIAELNAAPAVAVAEAEAEASAYEAALDDEMVLFRDDELDQEVWGLEDMQDTDMEAGDEDDMRHEPHHGRHHHHHHHGCHHHHHHHHGHGLQHKLVRALQCPKFLGAVAIVLGLALLLAPLVRGRMAARAAGAASAAGMRTAKEVAEGDDAAPYTILSDAKPIMQV